MATMAKQFKDRGHAPSLAELCGRMGLRLHGYSATVPANMAKISEPPRYRWAMIEHLRGFVSLLVGVGWCAANPAGCARNGAHQALPGALADNEYMLPTPSGDPEGLLGRAAWMDPATGRLHIADARAPGCSVKIRREHVPELQTTYTEDSHRVATLSLGKDTVAGLMVQYSKGLKVHARIDHTEVLRADISGPCGDQVVTKVNIGTGERKFSSWRKGGGEAQIPALVLVGATAGGQQRVDAEIRWRKPLAWAITIDSGSTEAVEMTIVMRPHLNAGEFVDPQIQVHSDMWLVALTVDTDGNYGVILPPQDPNVPPTFVRGGRRVLLSRFRALAAPGRDETQEKLLVFGFLHEGDYHEFKPPAGVLSPDAATEYGKTLHERLEGIPRQRWALGSLSYVVHAHPRQGEAKE